MDPHPIPGSPYVHVCFLENKQYLRYICLLFVYQMDSTLHDSSVPWIALLITNISKSANIKSLLLAAYAFGCRQIFVCNQPKFNFDYSHPNSDIPKQLQDGFLKIFRFHSFDECVQHIRLIGAQLVGVEIHDDAIDIEEDTCFMGDTVLIMGNEATGLNSKHCSACSKFIRISQCGGGTASLNVYVAASIVLHRFQIWSNGQNKLAT